MINKDIQKDGNFNEQQEAQLSQRDHARFVLLNILLSHSRSFEVTLLSRACVSRY